MTSRGPGTGRIAALLFLALALPATPLHAQTIRPVIVEYTRNKAQGRFELVNDGVTPLNVVLEPKSFDITEAGEAIYRPLDPRIHLRLSTMSVRIPAKQSRYVFYEATCDSLPAWFVIPCTFSGLPPQRGMEVRVELPHTVYLVQKHPLAREDVAIRTVVFDGVKHVVKVELENVGPRLGRAMEADVAAGHHHERQPSFPMPPRARRWLAIPWNETGNPERVVIRFHGFSLERKLDEAVRAEG